jgi:hypothetical protein
MPTATRNRMPGAMRIAWHRAESRRTARKEGRCQDTPPMEIERRVANYRRQNGLTEAPRTGTGGLLGLTPRQLRRVKHQLGPRS